MVIKKISAFQVWMKKNYIWFLPTISLVVGTLFNFLIYPLVVAFWTYLGSINISIADTRFMKPKVLEHEQVIYTIQGSLQTLVKQNDLILNGKYRDIKEYIEQRDSSK